MTKPLFQIEDLTVSVEEKKVLKDFSLSVGPGEVHALMGRNGSGKTTLSYTLMGHPRYKVESGSVLLEGENLCDLTPDQRAKRGLFLSFQYPVAVPGVTVANFLRTSIRSIRGENLKAKEIRSQIKKQAQLLEVPDSFLTRYLNDGFSGGEKKRLETLQMKLLQPKVSILDETDSGLDIDALKLISENINELRSSERSFLLITHYKRILDYIKPDYVHVLMDGRIVESGGPELAEKLEAEGYDWVSPTRNVKGSQLENSNHL